MIFLMKISQYPVSYLVVFFEEKEAFPQLILMCIDDCAWASPYAH